MADFTDEQLPEDLRKIIHTLRIFLYENDGEVLKQALAGTQDLAQGAASIVYLLVKMYEQQTGDQLDEEELVPVITHLAGSIAEFAHASDDPDAQDLQTAVMDIRDAAMEKFDVEDDGDEMAEGAAPAVPPEEAASAPPQGLMYQ